MQALAPSVISFVYILSLGFLKHTKLSNLFAFSRNVDFALEANHKFCWNLILSFLISNRKRKLVLFEF